MNISHYRYVIAIAEHQNMSKAAQSLYISQPALTRSINKLEQTLGVKLFDRDVSPIRLTYAGTVFLQEARRILQINDQLHISMQEIASSEQGKLVLGIPGERGSSYLPVLLPAFSRICPKIEVQIVEGHSNILEEKMEAGDVDLSIYTMPVASSSIEYEIVTEEPMVIISGRNSDFAQQFDLSNNAITTPYFIPPNVLDGKEFLLVNKGSGMRRISEYILDLHNIRYHIHRELYRHETIVRLVAACDGIAFSSCVTPVRLGIESQLAYFTLDNPMVTRKIIIAYKKYRALPSYMQDFIRITHELINTTEHNKMKEFSPVPALWK